MALGTQFANNILGEELNKTAIRHVKGVFTSKRNYKIACRFYYYFTLKGLRYERCVTALHEEFDLCETRIAQLIMENGDHLKKFAMEKPDRKYFAKEMPHYNWS